MLAVIFEAHVTSGRQDEYLDHAARLRKALDGVEGFISVERFRSLADPDKLLSISYWESEDALVRWRNDPGHREAQHAGRAGIFADYRISVASVMRQYSATERAHAPTATP